METHDAARRLIAGNRGTKTIGYVHRGCDGKSAEEIRWSRTASHSKPEDELQIAADEQRKITEIRLNKLITS